MRRFTYSLLALVLALPTAVLAQGQGQAATQPFTYQRVIRILFGLVQFVYTIGLVLAVIMIVWSSIQISTGRDVEKAKKTLLYSIIGVAVILGVNIILATVQSVVFKLTL